MTEIQGKLIFVRVIARFDLARVRVIGSQLLAVSSCVKRSPLLWNLVGVDGEGLGAGYI